MQIHYVNFCFGARVGNDIYLHNKLKNFPLLHNSILNHELTHSSGITIKDFFLDLIPERKNKELKKERNLFYRSLTRKERLILLLHNLSPIWKINNAITLNVFKIIMYTLGCILGYFGGLLLRIIV